MSIQLILFPQNYNGYSYTTSTNNQWIVDGTNFTSMNSSASCDSNAVLSLAPLECINAENVSSGIIVNTWYRFRTITPTPALPTMAGGNLVLYTAAPLSVEGVYQRLDGLTVGQIYNITINYSALPSASTLKCFIYYGTFPQQITFTASAQATSGSTQLTMSFAADSPQNIISIQLTGITDDTMTISNITMTSGVVSPTQIYTNLEDGQVICDLYQEEDIPLTLSVDDFKNVAEQVKSYSKDFNLPATKRNNRIFDNMFEITRSTDRTLIFNPYVQTKCVLKQDGIILFEGFLRMIDIKDKNGEISYNVNLFSEVIALADVLKDRAFSNLDLTELEHEYNRTQIKRSWNNSGTGITYLNSSTSGFRDAYTTLRYPFIDWTGQTFISIGAGSATAGNPQLPNLQSAFRPCIQLKYLIDRIFADTDFTYSSSLFDTADFKKLYMDFNWGKDNVPVTFDESGELTNSSYYALTTSYIDLTFDDMPSQTLGDVFGYDAGIFTAQHNGQMYYVTSMIIFEVGFVGADVEIQLMVNGVQEDYWLGTAAAQAIFGFNGLQNTPIGPLQAGDTWSIQAKRTHPVSVGDVSPTVTLALTTQSYETTTGTLLQTNRGEIGQWDFLKGIFTMFNLITMVDEDNPNNIVIETYVDTFIDNTNSGNTSNLTLAARSIEHDWTDKVDVSSMELRPLTDLNRRTVFKFVEDDDDYVFNVVKSATGGYLYGSKVYPTIGSAPADFTILEGTKEIIAEPFAATVSRPLYDQFSSFIIPSVYTRNGDGTYEGFDNSPRIFYNNGKSLQELPITYLNKMMLLQVMKMNFYSLAI